MPLALAQDLVADSMEKNLKVADSYRQPYIEVVKNIYKYVYEDTKITKGNISQAIIPACANYKNTGADQQKIKLFFENNPQSAWDPNKRVSLCQKAGETAGNIAAARDKGMTRSQVTAMVDSALANDTITLVKAPAIIDEVFSNTALSLVTFYAYNLERCEAEKNGKSVAKIPDIRSELLKCQNATSKEERSICFSQLFK